MSAYTPGPWSVGPLVHEIRGPRGELLAELASLGERYAETAPNGRLMAAAPVMAEALRDCIGALEDASYACDPLEAIRKGREALRAAGFES